jgi:hypothetical protein
MVVKLTCRGRDCDNEAWVIVPEGAPLPDFLCDECSKPKLLPDRVDWSQIGKNKLARMLAWRREAAAQREIERLGGEGEDGYDVYKRKKNTAWKFLRRNGFTVSDWHDRVDALGWRCTSCGRRLTTKTVLRRSMDGTKKLESQVPICRSCHCQRLGRQALSDHISR